MRFFLRFCCYSHVLKSQVEGKEECKVEYKFFEPSRKKKIELMHNDVTRPEKQYGSCSYAQIQGGGQ